MTSSAKKGPALIGDIGSSTGKWVWTDGVSTREHKTDGFNPNVHSLRKLIGLINEVRETVPPFSVCYYYGSGISTSEVAGRVAALVREHCPKCEAVVESDLLGAARGLCGSAPGAVGILGTGSNAALYDGRKIVKQTGSLGYPLGDEGSGWRIGAALVREYYYGLMPVEIRDAFREYLPDTRGELIAFVRNSPSPNRYLASFATFAADHATNEWMNALVIAIFDDYVKKQLIPIVENEGVHFVGNVAFNFSEMLQNSLTKHGLSIRSVTSDPVNGLVAYHNT